MLLPLLCIGWEVGVVSGAEDILYVDRNGLLTVVETKLRKNPEARREVVGQILEYAAQMSTWTSADVERQAEKFFASHKCAKEYAGATLEEALRLFLESGGQEPGFSYEDFLQQVQTNIERGHFRLAIAIDEPPEPLLKTVEFVNRFSERFEMYLIQLKRFRDLAQEQNIFVPALFGRVPGPEGKRRSYRVWDREGFLQQAQEKFPQGLSVLKRLIEFAEEEKAIVWGRGASIATFTIAFASPNGKSLSGCLVGANGRMSYDFWTLSKWLDPKVVISYREDLAHAEDIPREAVTTTTWKEFDVAALASTKSWEAFRHAILNLRRAIASPPHG